MLQEAPSVVLLSEGINHFGFFAIGYGLQIDALVFLGLQMLFPKCHILI